MTLPLKFKSSHSVLEGEVTKDFIAHSPSSSAYGRRLPHSVELCARRRNCNPSVGDIGSLEVQLRIRCLYVRSESSFTRYLWNQIRYFKVD